MQNGRTKAMNKVTRITIAFPKYISSGVYTTDTAPVFESVSQEIATMGTWMNNVSQLVKDINQSKEFQDGDIECLMQAHLGVKANIIRKNYTKTRRTFSHAYLTITEETI